MAISEQWAQLLEPGLRRVYMDEYEALAGDSPVPAIFNVQNSTKAQEHDLGIGAFSNWRPYTGKINYQENEQLWKTTYTHEEFAEGIFVERSLVDDDLYNVINNRARGLAMGGFRKREVDAASVFNNAFSASYIGGDGIALCGSHPYSPSNATTQSNAGSTALSYDAIIATRKLMKAFVDDRGNKIPINPDTLIVPLELEDAAWVAVQSMSKPGTANNDGNFVRSKGFNVIVWDYLTDSNNWFMTDSRLAGLFLNWFDRVDMEFAMDPTSDFNLIAKYRGYMRYSYGWSDWRWVYGHAVA